MAPVGGKPRAASHNKLNFIPNTFPARLVASMLQNDILFI